MVKQCTKLCFVVSTVYTERNSGTCQFHPWTTAADKNLPTSWIDGHLSGQSSVNVDIRLGKVGQWPIRQPADLAKSNTHVNAIYVHFQEPRKNQQRKDCFKSCFFAYLGQGLFTRCDCGCDLFISPQLKGGMGFSVVVTIAPCEHLH